MYTYQTNMIYKLSKNVKNTQDITHKITQFKLNLLILIYYLYQSDILNASVVYSSNTLELN